MNTLKIIQHNCNTWQNKRFELANVYKNTNPDIILLNDTGKLDGVRIRIPSFDVHTRNTTDRVHGGTAIAIRSTIKYRLHDDFESDLLAVTVETRQGPLTIATDYIPPSVGYINFIDYNYLLNRRYPVYLFGDLNARHSILGHNNNNTVGNNLSQLIGANRARHLGPNFPTLLRGTGCTTPDIVLCNRVAFHNIHLEGGPLTSSDHIPIIARISGNPIQIPIKPRYQFDRADWEGYQEELESVIPPDLNFKTTTEIDEHLEIWTNKIKEATQRYVPVLTHRIIPGVKPTRQLEMLQLRYQAIKDYIEEHGINPQIMQRINETRGLIRNAYSILRDDTWNELIHKIKIDEKDPIKFWKSVQRMMGNQKQKVPYIRNAQNERLHTPEEKEEVFRAHWRQIFRNDQNDDEFDQNNIELVNGYIQEHAEELVPHHQSDEARLSLVGCPTITLEELKTTIKHFRQKAPGPSEITPIQLKKLPESMLKYYLNILNASLSAGYFPRSMKHAVMIFLPKGTSSQYEVKNYRPISLLNTEGKVFDRILNVRFSCTIEANGHVNPRQHGFRRGRGTHTALATLYETIANNISIRNSTDVILRDVQKAFDKVWHDGLRYKLSQIDLHPCFLRILSNYLEDRKASIRIDNYLGPPIQLRSGVPQGACLSPTLYGFFTRDIEEPPPQTDYIAYADDITQITATGSNHRYVARLTQRAIEHVNTFEKKWKIKTNTNKFNIIPISRRKTDNIQIGNLPLEYQRSGKVLGLNIKSNGISAQVGVRKQIAMDNLSKIQRFKHLSKAAKTKLYNSLVLSALIYPTVPLNTLHRNRQLELQRVQNKGLRFITGASWMDYRTMESLHHECKMLPVNIVIHNQSKKTWEHIRDSFPDTYNKLVENHDPHLTHFHFLSSRKAAEGRAPAPIYR